MPTQVNSVGTPNARNLIIVKSYFKKPMALVIGLISLIMLVLNIISSAQTQQMAQQISSSLNMSEEISASSNSNIISFIISGIIVLCLLMIYCMSLSSNPKSSPAPFFSILHVFSCIAMVGTIIVTFLWAIVTIVLIVNGKALCEAIVKALTEQGFALSSQNITEMVEAFRVSFIVVAVIMLVAFVLSVFYYTNQTSFLKSCKRSCKEPALQKKGASAYGNFSIILAILQLVMFVVIFMLAKMASTTGDDSLSSIFGSGALGSMMGIGMVTTLLQPIQQLLIGVYAKGYAKHVDENAQYSYAYAAASAASRGPEVNPIATFTTETRKSNNAIRQNQAYLYGEEEPAMNEHKKSSYIPEELQEDYLPEQQFDPQQNPYGMPMQFDPQFGQPDPYANAMPPQPMGYGQTYQDPNNQNPYNNGMM